jgi:sugar phosphate isomerase/epimerase
MKMTCIARRRFLLRSGQLATATLLPSWLANSARANPLGMPVGIQLYTVDAAMQADPAGTLRRLRDIGYREVETAGFGKLSAKLFRELLDASGLTCPSAHLPFDLQNLNATFEAAHALGAKYAASGSLDHLVPATKAANATWAPTMHLEQAKRTAAVANQIGDAAKASGLQYVYHNHDFEFSDVGKGLTGYDLLLRETDPALVKFEIDCGWMVFAGRNPVDYFTRHPDRFPLIHVKDFLRLDEKNVRAGKMSGTEVGRGVVDYKPIFAAAKKAGLEHYFVEQEPPFSLDPLTAARVSYDYLHALD